MTRLNEVAIRRLFGGITEEPTTGTGTAGATNDLPDMNFRWGTVTVATAGEVEVLLDGDTEPVPVGPNVLDQVTVGQRVWCQLFGRRVIILGAAGGGTSGGAVGGVMAAGTVSITPPANGTANATVLLPTGKFSADGGPVTVQLTPRSTNPQYTHATSAGPTATNFVCYVFRNAATSTPVAWLATQGYETAALADPEPRTIDGDDAPEPVDMRIVTCRNPACPDDGVARLLDVGKVHGDEEVVTPGPVVCSCGVEVTDIEATDQGGNGDGEVLPNITPPDIEV